MGELKGSITRLHARAERLKHELKGSSTSCDGAHSSAVAACPLRGLITTTSQFLHVKSAWAPSTVLKRMEIQLEAGWCAGKLPAATGGSAGTMPPARLLMGGPQACVQGDSQDERACSHQPPPPCPQAGPGCREVPRGRLFGNEDQLDSDDHDVASSSQCLCAVVSASSSQLSHLACWAFSSSHVCAATGGSLSWACLA